MSDEAKGKRYREVMSQEFDTGLHLSRYSDANDDMKAVRARYEAAKAACYLPFDEVRDWPGVMALSLADIPRLLGEVERLTKLTNALSDTNEAERELRAAVYDELESLRAQLAEKKEKPIDMLLFCPACGLQHIDAPDLSTNWTNPPHKSHTCRIVDGGCGTIWRPADVRTNGVAAIQTRGDDDTWDGNNVHNRLAERDAENKRLREAVEGIQERASKFLPADFRPGRIGTARGACLWIFNECKGILRRASEAMEGKVKQDE